MTIPILDPDETTRREFCAHACQALSFAALGAIIQGCGGSPTSPSGSAPALSTATATLVNGALVLTIDAASPLSSVGSAALVESSSGRFLVAHIAVDTFVAVTAVCTHEGCTITGFSNQIYVCPCHGSRFNTSGSVVSGPASTALRRFTTQFANNTLIITL